MKKERILSIDIFRGLTIFLMVFVNDLAGVSNIPGWMKHVAADFDGMTFVDVVFPAFLFIVGMAIPFAVENRQRKGDTKFAFWKHVLVRTLGLLILGVFMVNSGEMNREANLIPHGLWAASLYIAAILIWNRYPKTDQVQKNRIFAGLRIIGFIVLIVLYYLYRKGPDDQLTGMTPSWWGILGLIGWAYLFSIILFICASRKLQIMLPVFAIVLLIFLGLKIEDFPVLSDMHWLKGHTGHFAHTLLTLAGILCSLMLMRGGLKENPVQKIRSMVLLGLALSLVAFLVRPYTGGLSKIGGTPAWSLYCAAICSLLFPLIYWLVDLKGVRNWSNFLKPAGQNPLLTYILPPLFYAIAGFSYLPAMFNTGALGFIRSVIFSLLILWAAGLLTKKGIKLHL